MSSELRDVFSPVWRNVVVYIGRQLGVQLCSRLRFLFSTKRVERDMDSSLAKFTGSPHISDIAEGKKEHVSLPSTSLEFLKQHTARVKRLRVEFLNELTSNTLIDVSYRQDLSTARIMKLAKEQLHKLNSQKIDVLSYVIGRLRIQSGLLSEVPGDLELALLLRAASEKVANQQYVKARKLLSLCGRPALKSGNPVQRLVYCFAEALNKKIDQEWGLAPSDQELEVILWGPVHEAQAQLHKEPVMMTSQQETPFGLITEFIATESILDAVASAKRVHLIDFQINSGSHWTLIMQAFATRYECPLELLRITAVGTCKLIMEETGKSLSSFAESLNLPFSYKMVVSDLKDLKKECFELEIDEVLAIYSDLRFYAQLASPGHLKALMGAIEKLKPKLMVVKEMEASTNAPNFIDRFEGALLLFSGLFDIMMCMDHHISYRKMNEEVVFPYMIQNIIATEGMERVIRHERVSFWRALFAQFGMEETDLSRPSLGESLFLRSSERFSSCTVDMDGKCLILRCKGAPILSLSAWKFQSN